MNWKEEFLFGGPKGNWKNGSVKRKLFAVQSLCAEKAQDLNEFLNSLKGWMNQGHWESAVISDAVLGAGLWK